MMVMFMHSMYHVNGKINAQRYLIEIIECQRCKGNYVVESKPVKRIKIKRAKYVHHIIAMKDCFELALDDDNLVSLCFECHEIVEGRDGTWKKFKHKKKLTKEMW